MTMKDGFEMVLRPEFEIERVHQNMRENKAPNFMGDTKLHVGNIVFECAEDIFEIFGACGHCGMVGYVSLVRDDDCDNRGFG